MDLPRPFIYISALMRTGSTMLSEALTALPDAFLFHEPHLGKNAFSLRVNDRLHLQEQGVNMAAFLQFRRPMAFLFRRLRWLGYPQDYMLKECKRALQPLFAAAGIQQMGVKEIKHEGWPYYVRHFPDLKMVMLGRDPRDIYISAFQKWQLGTTLWNKPFNPETVAEELNRQFEMQLAMKAQVDCFPLRYQELCTDAEAIERVKKFVHSPIPTLGEIGKYIKNDPKRAHENQIHQGKITALSVNRWQQETDEALLADAFSFFDFMPEYVNFWGYEK